MWSWACLQLVLLFTVQWQIDTLWCVTTSSIRETMWIGFLDSNTTKLQQWKPAQHSWIWLVKHPFPWPSATTGFRNDRFLMVRKFSDNYLYGSVLSAAFGSCWCCHIISLLFGQHVDKLWMLDHLFSKNCYWKGCIICVYNTESINLLCMHHSFVNVVWIVLCKLFRIE